MDLQRKDQWGKGIAVAGYRLYPIPRPPKIHLSGATPRLGDSLLDG